jgi:hypothetical protein
VLRMKRATARLSFSATRGAFFCWDMGYFLFAFLSAA